MNWANFLMQYARCPPPPACACSPTLNFPLFVRLLNLCRIATCWIGISGQERKGAPSGSTPPKSESPVIDFLSVGAHSVPGLSFAVEVAGKYVKVPSTTSHLAITLAAPSAARDRIPPLVSKAPGGPSMLRPVCPPRDGPGCWFGSAPSPCGVSGALRPARSRRLFSWVIRLGGVSLNRFGLAPFGMGPRCAPDHHHMRLGGRSTAQVSCVGATYPSLRLPSTLPPAGSFPVCGPPWASSISCTCDPARASTGGRDGSISSAASVRGISVAASISIPAPRYSRIDKTPEGGYGLRALGPHLY